MIKFTDKLKALRGSMGIDRPGKHPNRSTPGGAPRAKIRFHRPLYNAIGTVAFMTFVLLLSVKSDFLFFKELTQAFSFIGMLLFVKAFSQPLPSEEEEDSNPNVSQME